MFNHPNIDPVLFQLGPLELRWYGLSYIVGLWLGVYSIQKRLKKQFNLSPEHITNFMLSIMIGVILGGRIGYIIFYNLSYYLHNPLDALSIWQGGMSYHGGAIGAMTGVLIFARQNKLSSWGLLDCLGLGSTIAIFFGRLANFINQELVGRITDVPWAVVFPLSGGEPRHPSQLYEAFGEGLFLFGLLLCLDRFFKLKDGQLFGLYLIGYGIIRFCLEFFREPDTHLGFIIGFLTMGQLLCLLMISLGLAITLLIKRHSFQSIS